MLVFVSLPQTFCCWLLPLTWADCWHLGFFPWQSAKKLTLVSAFNSYHDFRNSRRLSWTNLTIKTLIRYCHGITNNAGPWYTPVAEENGKDRGAADDSEVSPGGESHRYPGDRQWGECVTDHDHQQRNGSAGDATIFNNWNLPVTGGVCR